MRHDTYARMFHTTQVTALFITFWFVRNTLKASPIPWGMPNLVIHAASNLALLWLISRFDSKAFSEDTQGITLAVFASHLIDIDHLLADPIYDPARCSITAHPLHHPVMWVLYAGLALFRNRRVRYFGVALVLHLVLDALWCLW